jgi:hypothetical protein
VKAIAILALMAEATSEQLWDVVVPDPDFREGQHQPPWLQCFSCAYYHELHGEHGADWGVCFNPQSPRKGLLSWEHFGCAEWKVAPKYEEDWAGA